MSKRMHRAVLAAPLLAGLAGCGSPGVLIEPMPPSATGADAANDAANAAEKGALPVALPSSRIVVTPAKAGDAAQYAVTVLPRAGAQRYRVRPFADLASQNDLRITYAEGSDLPKAVGNTFTDLSAKRIEQLGGIIGSLIDAAGSQVGAATVANSRCAGAAIGTVYLDIDRPIPAAGLGGDAPSADGKPGCFRWRLAPVPGSAAAGGTVPLADYATLVANRQGRAIGFWPVAACREVELSVTRLDRRAATMTVRTTVADPERVQLFPLPRNGTLTMHPVCGADLADKPVDRWQAVADAFSALDKQVQAVGKKLEPK